MEQMIPKKHQEVLAAEGYQILKENAIVYLACEERTGKTLAAILIAEMSTKINNVLVLTKKNAIPGWTETLERFKHTKNYTVTNYHQAKKLEANYDLVILDESHNYISSYPKPSSIWKAVKKLSRHNPLIFISATPHAQGYQQLYHQFALSEWSPWHTYKNFYQWFRHYGIPQTIWIAGQQKAVYTNTEHPAILASSGHLFITKTRKELDFAHEPEDKIHYITLDEQTKDEYNILMKDRLLERSGLPVLACDSPMKLRTSLHMLEGGVAKVEEMYFILPNREKIDYIKNTWGDSRDLAIFYNYIAEGQKLRTEFKHAQVLQATSNAEGIDLSHVQDLVIYSQDFSTARHTQRRARQANYARDTEIVVHFLLVEKAVSEQVYNTVSINKQNFVDAVFEKDPL